MTEWQPIDTAPRDGKLIDVWSKRDGRIPNAFWGETSYSQKICDEFTIAKEGWCVEHSDGWVFRVLDATHWVPLPAPPTD